MSLDNPACINLTADDDGGDRLPRLVRTRDRIPHATQQKIAHLHDHEGILSVHWLGVFTNEDARAVDAAWASENEDAIEHHLEGQIGS